MTSTDAHQNTIKYSASQDSQEFWLSAARIRFDDEICCDINAIDRELQALTTALRFVRVRRNRITIAARLPAEILTTIFEFVRQEFYGGHFFKRDFIGDRPMVKNIRWTALSHVCQWWRQVVLDSPNLWQEINFALCGLNWAREMVTRSKATPLCVDINDGIETCACPRHYAANFVDDLLTNHAGRLRTFSISGEDIFPHIQQLNLSPELPALECLFIVSSNYGTTAVATPRLSLSLIAERMPNLCQFYMERVIPLDVPSITFDNLTLFDLVFPEPPSVDGLTLLDILKCMPVLEWLNLTNYPSEELPEELQPLDLPETLQGLALYAEHYSNGLPGFSRILAHPTACRSFTFSNQVEPRLSNALLSPGDGTERSLRSLHFEVTYMTKKMNIEISAKFTPWPASADGNKRTPRPDVSIAVKNIDLRIWYYTLEGLDLREIIDLSVSSDGVNLALGGWSELSSRAPNVRHLRVIGRVYCTLFHPLMMNDDFFPFLSSLSIIDSQDMLQREEDELQGARSLLAALEARRRWNMPIRDLKVPDRMVNGAWTEPLRAIVDKFGGSRPRFY